MSSFCMLLSTLISAACTPGLSSMVALLSTLTLVCGQYLSLSSKVSSMISGKSGCPVGSPLPENVITSGSWSASLISMSRFSKASATCSRVGRGEWVTWSLLKPHSQYTQSKSHTLPSAGIKLTPSDMPSLRLCTGPNTGESYKTVLMSVFPLDIDVYAKIRK